MTNCPNRRSARVPQAPLSTIVFLAGCLAPFGLAHGETTSAGDLAAALKALRAVGPESAGTTDATQAWRKVSAASADELPVILAAMDDAGALAANWLRAAVDAIAERQLREEQPLPAAELEAFVRDTGHAPRARRLAFEWLLRANPAARERLLPGFLNDPSVELRRDAVARLIELASALQKFELSDAAGVTFAKAMSGARDLDQVRQLKAELERLGQKVELPLHFGFIVEWKLIGPFDNTGEGGFDVAYPPEKAIELAAEHDGKPLEGQRRPLRWIDFTTADEYGVVDLNQALGKANGVLAYAYAEFESDHERPAELRLGRDNAAKIWLNGELLHEHRVYHSGFDIDQYIARGKLRRGRNQIMLKICQNEQTEEWAQGWGFQLRVCDAAGTAILSKGRQATA
ncbi:MAG TPA: hypothetical protein VGX76_08785, partial [Pirellulales bacterium]|nr:hypothetical protein [Pirellulales bacterium]